MGISLLIGNGLNRCENEDVAADNLIQELEKEFSPNSGGLISKTKKAFPLQFEAIFSCTGKSDDVKEGFKALERKLKCLNKTNNRVLLSVRPTLEKVDAILTTNYDFALEHYLYKGDTFKTKALGKNRGYVSCKEYSSPPPIYHIHGDIYEQHAKNLCLGFFGYQKYLRSSVSNLKQDLKRYIELDDPFSELKKALPESLFRLFIDDIYIVGFGLSECELVLWNLLTIRKELIRLGVYKKAPGGKPNTIVFYDACGGEQKKKAPALKKYYGGFHIIYEGSAVKKNGYRAFYKRVFKKIEKVLG